MKHTKEGKPLGQNQRMFFFFSIGEGNDIVIYYFDHAASSWPKPEAVITTMENALRSYAANPGRGSHQLAMRSSRTLFETRVNLATLFNVQNPIDISFSFNTSLALNLAIKGFLKAGDHVITTSVEHNSVRRPLEALKKSLGIEVTYIKTDERGKLDLKLIEEAIQKNTVLLICSHSSNLLGSILPLQEISEIVKPFGVKLLVDAAQTAGSLRIDVQKMGIDMLAFPGHKGLLGPQGTGGLYISPEIELEPLIHGGTGSQSESIEQPDVRPDRYETGTQNTAGIAGLNEGVKYVIQHGVENIYRTEWLLTQCMMRELNQISEVKIFGPDIGVDKTGIVTFEVQGIEASELAHRLDREYNIAVRAGHHCTPLAHETIGTAARGAVRASLGVYTTEDDVSYFIHSLKKILKGQLQH